MKGSNKTQLDEATRLLTDHKANLSYVQADELDAIKSAVVDPNIYKGNAIQALVGNMQSLKVKLDEAIDAEKTAAITKIENLEAKLTQYDGYIALQDDQKSQVLAAFSAAKDRVGEHSLIAMIRDAANNFDNQQYGALLQQIEDWNHTPDEPVIDTPVDKPSGAPTGIEDKPKQPYTPSKPTVVIVNAKELSVSFAKPLLESEADIDAYLESYKQALVNTVKQGKKVSV
jgi:hypothetical protein